MAGGGIGLRGGGERRAGDAVQGVVLVGAQGCGDVAAADIVDEDGSRGLGHGFVVPQSPAGKRIVEPQIGGPV